MSAWAFKGDLCESAPSVLARKVAQKVTVKSIDVKLTLELQVPRRNFILQHAAAFQGQFVQPTLHHVGYIIKWWRKNVE